MTFIFEIYFVMYFIWFPLVTVFIVSNSGKMKMISVTKKWLETRYDEYEEWCTGAILCFTKNCWSKSIKIWHLVVQNTHLAVQNTKLLGWYIPVWQDNNILRSFSTEEYLIYLRKGSPHHAVANVLPSAALICLLLDEYACKSHETPPPYSSS